MKLDSSEGANLINIQYAVMFGIIFTFSFYLNNNQSNFHIIPAISSNNIWLFILLLFYFLISWVTSNYIRGNIEFTPFYIVTWTIAIWYLGAVVIMINSLGSFKYLFLSSYISIVSLYDFIAYGDNSFYCTDTLSSIIWKFFTGISLILGFFLLIPTLIVTLDLIKIVISFEKFTLVIALIFVFIRFIRFLWIAVRG